MRPRRSALVAAVRADRYVASSSPLAAASADAVPAPAGGCAHGCGSRPCRRLRLHDQQAPVQVQHFLPPFLSLPLVACS